MRKTRSRLKRFCATLVMGLLLAAGLPAQAQLDILLTNDDGFGDAGIDALKLALHSAGHLVTVGAPDGDASTSSASFDVQRPVVQVICPEVDECKVRAICVESITAPAGCTTLESLGGATPVVSALSTIAAVEEVPGDFDLLISGINNDTSTGPQVPFSGTVGATIGAISKNVGNIPGIAVSLQGGDEAAVATYEETAAFVVKLVRVLEERRHGQGKLLPDGVGLNINYPDLAPGDLAGVKLTVQGRFDEVPGDQLPRQMFVTRYRSFEPLEDDHVFIPQRETVPMDGREVPRADTTALAKGFITITPIAADYTAGWVAQFRMKRLLKELLWGKHRRYHYYDRH